MWNLLRKQSVVVEERRETVEWTAKRRTAHCGFYHWPVCFDVHWQSFPPQVLCLPSTLWFYLPSQRRRRGRCAFDGGTSMATRASSVITEAHGCVVPWWPERARASSTTQEIDVDGSASGGYCLIASILQPTPVWCVGVVQCCTVLCIAVLCGDGRTDGG